jgi:integrase
MASIHRKTGASGAQSPFWIAKFRGLEDGQVKWLSTKQEDARKARAVAGKFEEAVQLAKRWELTQTRTQKFIADMAELTKDSWSGAKTVEITRTFLSDLLAETIGEELAGQNFEKFCTEWLKDKKDTRSTAPSTVTRYAGIVTSFLDYLPPKRRSASVGSISAGEIQRFRNSEIEAGKSAVTANFQLNVLRSIFSDARRHGIVESNPAEMVRLLPEEGEERTPFDEAQIKALLAVADAQWKGMILLASHAGLRLRDASDLTWENVGDDCRTLTFRAKKTAKRKKQSGKDSVVFLHSDLKRYLDELPTNDNPKAPLFPSLYGRKSGSSAGLSNEFSRLMQKAGIRPQLGTKKAGKGRRFRALGFHSLRHTFVSRLADLEVSSDVRKEIVGHSSDDIHRRYTHLSLALQQAAISKLPSLL